MDPERWRQISQLYKSALECAPDRRAAFLMEVCPEDEPLRQEVEELIALGEPADELLESPVLTRAAPLLAADLAELERGRMVGHYKILERIGVGGMGEVYLARDTRLGRKIALKLLPSHFSRDEDRVRRFVQEARSASVLNHPNILTVHEIGQFEGHHFIATEFIDGVTLRRRMSEAEGGTLNVREALDIATQVAGALAKAHQAGIIHRDIKPENIMLDTEGHAKVLDFGLAKQTIWETTDDTETPPLGTAPGMIMGTVTYMSPEQVRGLDVDARADVWGLGVVVYEMVSGNTPFQGPTTSDVIAAILEREPLQLTNNGPEVPGELQQTISKALRKDTAERYQTADELAHDLYELRRRLDLEGLEPSPHQSRTEVVAPRTTSSAEYVVGAIKTHKRGTLFAIAALVLIIAAVASYYFYSHREDSIAVLPFSYTYADANPTVDLEREYVADGITESVINRLSQLPNLKVIARSSVFRYKGLETDPQKIGRELGVRTVLTGRITQRGEDLIISTELLDAQNNSHVWGEQYQLRVADLLTVQKEIAQRISENLRLRLTGEEQQRVVRRDTEDREAFRLYLLGRFHWNKRNPEGTKKAIEYFQQAIDRDPNFALAHAGLADCYALSASGLPPAERTFRARSAAVRALELDPMLAEAHATLGLIKYKFEWDWAGSEESFRRATALNQNYATAHHWYGEFLGKMGRFDEAQREFRRAYELDPLSLAMNVDWGRCFFNARQYDQAIEHLLKTVEMDGSFARAHGELALAYTQKGMFQEAVMSSLKARTLHGAAPEDVAAAKKAYESGGIREYRRFELDRLLKQSEQEYVPPYNFVSLYTSFGEKDKAFEWLEKSLQVRDDGPPSLRTDPRLDPLRSDPRFAEMLRRTGLF